MDAQLISTLFLFVLLFGAFYFFVMRPERRRRDQQRDLIQSLSRGDKIVTLGGICGVIKKVDNERIWVEVQDGVVIKMVKESVAHKDSAATVKEQP